MSNDQIRRILCITPAASWMGMIFLLSSRQTLPPPPGMSFSVAAIAGHFILYFILTCLLAIGLSGSFRPDRNTIWIAVLVSFVYGITDEIHQSFVPGRTATIFDVVVNGFGAVSAGVVANAASIKMRRRRSR